MDHLLQKERKEHYKLFQNMERRRLWHLVEAREGGARVKPVDEDEVGKGTARK